LRVPCIIPRTPHPQQLGRLDDTPAYVGMVGLKFEAMMLASIADIRPRAVFGTYACAADEGTIPHA